MKINYYEAFDLIAEEAVDLLAEHQSDDSFLDKFSVEDTLSAVQGNMTQKKVVKKRIPMRIRFLIAAVVVLAVSMISFADQDIGPKLLTDFNRHLAGKNIVGEPSVYDQDGNWVSGPIIEEFDLNEHMKVWDTSTVITKRPKKMPPYSISEFPVTNVDKHDETPEVIFYNGDMITWVQEDGSGWELEKGDTLSFTAEQYVHENVGKKGQTIHYGYVVNGKLIFEEEHCTGLYQYFEVKAEEKGEYYICLFNYTSESIALKKGIIMIQY